MKTKINQIKTVQRLNLIPDMAYIFGTSTTVHPTSKLEPESR